MIEPTRAVVEKYYNDRVDGKLRDFTHRNPRIEAAIQLIAEWAPPNPKRILEIGCGVGATSWRMARAWPQAEVVGADISIDSIEIAKKCFQRNNLTYRAGFIKKGVLSGQFDLVVLMDVYEHITLQDRISLHAVIKSILNEEARIVVTIPTPALQDYARLNIPQELQPVDEDVSPADALRFGQETATQLLYYRQVGIWRYGDYAHFVLGRIQNLSTVSAREYRPRGIAGLKRHVKTLLRGEAMHTTKRRDYLGRDVLARSARDLGPRFDVTDRERELLVAALLAANRS